MNRPSKALAVKLWGDYACFTRPEMKVERGDLPGHGRRPRPAGRWRRSSGNPRFPGGSRRFTSSTRIAYTSILRNEIKDRQSHRAARRWANSGGGYDASASRNRAQRHTLALRDVAYVVRAQLVLHEGVGGHIAKYRDQFRRRVASGRCFATPYLGCPRVQRPRSASRSPATRPSAKPRISVSCCSISTTTKTAVVAVRRGSSVLHSKMVCYVSPDRFAGVA